MGNIYLLMVLIALLIIIISYNLTNGVKIKKKSLDKQENRFPNIVVQNNTPQNNTNVIKNEYNKFYWGNSEKK